MLKLLNDKNIRAEFGTKDLGLIHSWISILSFFSLSLIIAINTNLIGSDSAHDYIVAKFLRGESGTTNNIELMRAKRARNFIDHAHFPVTTPTFGRLCIATPTKYRDIRTEIR